MLVREIQDLVELPPATCTDIDHKRPLNEDAQAVCASFGGAAEVSIDETGVELVVLPHFPGTVGWPLVVETDDERWSTVGPSQALISVDGHNSGQQQRKDQPEAQWHRAINAANKRQLPPGRD